MSTAPTTQTKQPAAKRSGKSSRGAAAAAAAAETQADEPGKMPADLVARGWVMNEHVDGGGKFQCANEGLSLTTSPRVSPHDAIEAARRLQAREDRNRPPAREAAAAADAPVAVGGRETTSRQFTRMLKVRLSPDGLQDKCAEYDAKCDEMERMASEFKKVHDRYKEDLKAVELEVQALSQVVRKQYVETEVPCEERMNYGAKIVRVVRLDTEEEIERREMTESETQQKLLSI